MKAKLTLVILLQTHDATATLVIPLRAHWQKAASCGDVRRCPTPDPPHVVVRQTYEQCQCLTQLSLSAYGRCYIPIIEPRGTHGEQSIDLSHPPFKQKLVCQISPSIFRGVKLGQHDSMYQVR
jgi:hypothetical protein